MKGGVLPFLLKVFTNDNKDLFTVRLGVTLILSSFNIGGLGAAILNPFLRGLIGLMISDGTFLIDLALDAYKEGQKLEEFKKDARAAYNKAIKGVHNEADKAKIRAEYLRIIKRITIVS